MLPELSFSDRWSRGTKLWERDWSRPHYVTEIWKRIFIYTVRSILHTKWSFSKTLFKSEGKHLIRSENPVSKFLQRNFDGAGINVFKKLIELCGVTRPLLCTSGLGGQEDHKWIVLCFFILQPSLGTLAWKAESPLVMERATSEQPTVVTG